jgi:hypothetical protein
MQVQGKEERAQRTQALHVAPTKPAARDPRRTPSVPGLHPHKSPPAPTHQPPAHAFRFQIEQLC